MLTNANEIGGISSCSYEDRVQYAKASQSWSQRIRSGSILVDHTEMMRMGLFPLTLEVDDREGKAMSFEAVANAPHDQHDETTQPPQHTLTNPPTDKREIVLFNGRVQLVLWTLAILFVWLNLL